MSETVEADRGLAAAAWKVRNLEDYERRLEAAARRVDEESSERDQASLVIYEAALMQSGRPREAVRELVREFRRAYDDPEEELTIPRVSGLMNAVMLPMYLASGVFFAYDKFPAVVQPAIRALPLTTLIDGLRAVANDGAGWAAAWKPCLLLAGWAAVSFALALRLFRWR